MTLLVEFLLRLAGGLAAAMALPSPRRVTSGFFRNHLYVTLGLATLAAVVAQACGSGSVGWAAAAAVASYLGAASWLYEQRLLGRGLMLIVAVAGIGGALTVATERATQTTAAATTSSSRRRESTARGPIGAPASWLSRIHVVSSSLLLGVTFASMLLGHWYLNSPGMQLAPLYGLLTALTAVLAAHALASGAGLALAARQGSQPAFWELFLALRWTFGLLGPAALIVMAWRTLAIPNTQSATGILYVAVIGVCVGETASLLLSAESAYPL